MTCSGSSIPCTSEKEEATRRKEELELTVKEKKGEGKSIQRQLDKKCMNNCSVMKELVDVQSKYPVLSITIGSSLAQSIALWLQPAESVPFAPPPAELVQMSHAELHPVHRIWNY